MSDLSQNVFLNNQQFRNNFLNLKDFMSNSMQSDMMNTKLDNMTFDFLNLYRYSDKYWYQRVLWLLWFFPNIIVPFTLCSILCAGWDVRWWSPWPCVWQRDLTVDLFPLLCCWLRDPIEGKMASALVILDDTTGTVTTDEWETCKTLALLEDLVGPAVSVYDIKLSSRSGRRLWYDYIVLYIIKIVAEINYNK